MVATKRKNSRTVADALNENAWIGDIAEGMTEESCLQCIRLWEAIERVQRDEEEPDKFSRKGSKTGRYTARETYKTLCRGREAFAMFKPVWKSYAPLKCKIFGWLALKYRL